jgi:hypothetical protein
MGGCASLPVTNCALGRPLRLNTVEPVLCTGFTGADLQNLMNESAIMAARRGLTEISKDEVADALERIVAGPEKKGAVVSDAKKRLVAFHEVCMVSCQPPLLSGISVNRFDSIALHIWPWNVHYLILPE